MSSPKFSQRLFLQRQPNNQSLLLALFFLVQFSSCELTFCLYLPYFNFILTGAANLRGS